MPRRRTGLWPTALASFGGLTTLVNAAGIIGSGSVESTTDAEWDAMMDINVARAVPADAGGSAGTDGRLAKREAGASVGGSIVNVSSVTGLRAFPGVLAYCVSKAAIDQLTRCAALELAAKGVRVNAVNPGVVVSNLHRRGGMNEENYAQVPRPLARNPPARPTRRSVRNRRPDLLPGVRCGGLDHRRDDLDRRRPSPDLRALKRRGHSTVTVPELSCSS